MLSFSLYPHLVQEARFFVMLVLFNIFALSSRKKREHNQNIIPITKHIMNRITNVLTRVLTIDFPAIANTMFALKCFVQLMRG